MKSRWILSALVAAAALGMQAVELSVSNSPAYYQKFSTANTLDVSSATEKQVGFPLVDGVVLFHFDCTQTNGWTITPDGQVLRVPSLVGSRYLTADSNDVHFADFTWKGWGWPTRANPNWVKPPTLSEGPGGRLVLDFGPQRSEHGLVFDLAQNAGTLAPSNSLYGFGTVAMVYDSTEGGGFFLGGGRSTGYGWHRGDSQISAATDDPLDYSNPIVNAHAFSAVWNGVFRHDGLETSGYQCGFAGQWETLVLQPILTYGPLDAQGLGLGDTREYAYNTWARRSSGMRIAEAVFFDRTLTAEEVRRVEVYLDRKWFGDEPRGWNGNAVVGEIHTDGRTDTLPTGVTTTFAVPAGEAATLVSLRGGHKGSSFTKTGDGMLKLGMAGNYGARLDVREGALSFERRAQPAALPTNWLVRLDASRTDKMTLGADDGVSWVADVGGHPFCGKPINLVSANAFTPKLRRDRLGAGKHTVDFGPVSTDGGYLRFTTNETAAADVSGIVVGGVCTYVAVLRNAGGVIVDGRNFVRNAQDTLTSWSGYLLCDETFDIYGSKFNARNMGRVYVDGILRNSGAGLPTPGWHTLAVRAPVVNTSGTGGIGGQNVGVKGGSEIAEIVVYDRVLSDVELRDAGAYLMNKWFGRTPYDYAGPGDETEIAAQNVHFGVEATGIDVPEGATVRVHKLDFDAPIEKTGAGTLIVEDCDPDQLLEIRDGLVKVAAPADVSSEAELAARPSFHLDPTAANTLVTETAGGTNFVRVWNTVDFANCAWAPYAGRLPWLVTDGLPEGLQGVDFGPDGVGTTNPCMAFGRSENNVRAAFVVWRPHGQRAFIFGQTDLNASSNYDFHRYPTAVNGEAGLFRNDLFAEVLTNGVVVGRDKPIPNDQWVLAEFYAKDDGTGGLTASALACDRDHGTGSSVENSRYGGETYGEIVIYDRELTAREKVATRNYLLAKWFPDSPRSELPALVVQTNGLYAVSAETDRTLDVEAGEAYVVAKVLGGGVLTKTGAGTFELRDLSEFTGTIAVTDGTLRLTGEPPPADSDAPVEDGRILHMDATCGVTAFTNAAGIAKVTAWHSKLDDGWTAEPFVDCADPNPTWLTAGLNGLPVVDLCAPRTTDELQGLRFKKDGQWQCFSNIVSAVWVFGSQNGGGYLMGARDSFWQRAGSGGLVASDNIFSGSARDVVRWRGLMYKNRVLHHYTDNPDGSWPKMSLSGRWDLIEWNAKEVTFAVADGFGFESSVFNYGVNGGSWISTGRQRLAEVIFYNRALTDAERLRNEDYLARKWGLLGMRMSVENDAAVTLAAGTVLDCGGKSQYVGALGGAGTVQGDVSAGALACDYAAPQTLTVTGVFTVPADGLEVALANFPQTDVDQVRVPILEATAFAAAEGELVAALRRTRFTGEGVAPGYVARLEVVDGVLTVAFKAKGLALIFR